MTEKAPSDRTRVKRIPGRGVYDCETIYEILDEGLVCHVGFAHDDQPYVIPTGYARDGDNLIIHGSSASRMMRELSGGINVCVTVTHLDALVLARSAFHHSMNYRSVVILGRATLIEDDAPKTEAMRLLVEHLIPGRWEGCRGPNDIEMKATTILTVPLDEASAKVRIGPPSEEDEDYALTHWAGQIPLPVVPGIPVPDPELSEGIAVPEYVKKYGRRR